MNFKDAILQLESYFSKQNFDHKKLDLYKPVNYIMASNAKRFRPALLLMSYGLFKQDFEKILPAAYGVELFHNFTLIHDDIMDEALIRRSQPSAHIKFGLNNAILSGDVMMMWAYKYLLKSVSLENAHEVISLVTKTAIEVCEGQSLDMQFENQRVVSVSDYLEMIKMKTAVLLASSLKLGALLAEANEVNQNELYQFGLQLGIAFQIQDDVLDTFGNQLALGKQIGGDILQKKKTYLIAKAIEVMSIEDATELKKRFDPLYKMDQHDVEWVIQLLRNNKIDQEASKTQNEFYLKAVDHLEKVECPSTKKFLEEMATSLFERSK